MSDFAGTNPWPEGLYERLDTFRQGHLVAGLPFVFIGAAGQCLWNGSIRERHLLEDANFASVEVAEGVPYAMLLTQACDLMKPGAWATVAPVYNAVTTLDGTDHGNVRAGRTFHLFPISPAWAQPEDLWVVDLRMEVCLDKALLFDRTPLEAFTDPAEYGRLRDHLGAVRQRAAVPTPAWDHVLSPMFDALDALDALDADESARLQQPLYEMRLQCNDPTNPSLAQVILVARDGMAGRVARDEWDDLLSPIARLAEAAGIVVPPMLVTTLWDMTARDYITSDRVEHRSSS